MAVNRVSNSPVRKIINTSVEENWCHTWAKVIKSNYTWTIHNFSFCCEIQDNIKSSSFSIRVDDKWHLEMYFDGDDEGDCISLFLVLDSHDTAEVIAKLELSILNGKREKIKNSKDSIYKFTQDDFSYGWLNFLQKDEILDTANGLLSNDELTIFCEVSIKADIINISCQNNVIQFNASKHSLIKDFELLFENQKFCDVTLTACGKEFQAHKAILAARSPVFLAMFEHDTEKNKKSCVDMTDLNPEVLKKMLQYIYTGKVENLDNLEGELLAVANKYGLESLKILCEKELFRNLKPRPMSS
ncbi:PREDICTED: protein roadkill-like [Vollenhovia emeryi]|uniref:protein roadkill-like n=1 Tax=Vollenhovia emeryi TaxID=411798 RepID=UPI0005F3DE76|nr:PREDICTED: protein roadkill-like [Vollenhovia emeryi]